AEEIGLELGVGALLAIDWAQPYGLEARPVMTFLFDGGALEDGAGIVLQREELDDFRFTDPAEVSGYLAPFGVRRLAAALAGRGGGAAVYQPTGAVGPTSSAAPATLRHRRAPRTSARWRSATSTASATVTGRPDSADSVVVVASLIPHGTMRSYQDRSQSQFRAKPCMVTPRDTRIPIAATFRSCPPAWPRTHTPLRPSTRSVRTPNAAQARISASSIART